MIDEIANKIVELYLDKEITGLEKELALYFLEIVPKELGEEMVKSFGKDRLISVMINFGKDTMNSEEIKPRTKKDIDNLIISMRKQRENWLQIKNCE